MQDAIKLCGDKIIYCDTDSVKTDGDVPIERLNVDLKKRAELVGAYADDMKGKRHYIGVFEPDGHYRQFITQGAKRYAYIDDRGRMGVTVAGVSKQLDEETELIDEDGEIYNPSFAVEELKSLNRFKPGMEWKKAGGTQAVYNDADDIDYKDKDSENTVHISKNVSIIPSTYIMTHSRDYARLLTEIQLYSEFRKERE